MQPSNGLGRFGQLLGPTFHGLAKPQADGLVLQNLCGSINQYQGKGPFVPPPSGRVQAVGLTNAPADQVAVHGPGKTLFGPAIMYELS